LKCSLVATASWAQGLFREIAMCDFARGWTPLKEEKTESRSEVRINGKSDGSATEERDVMIRLRMADIEIDLDSRSWPT
jgi:hypothetical protein